jgi:transposase
MFCDTLQDHASYHKDKQVWSWFNSNPHWLEVHHLPPYSPEFNPSGRLWQHTRKNRTHNRFFSGVDALFAALTRVFTEMQSYPQLIQSYLSPFCWATCPFIYAQLYSVRLLWFWQGIPWLRGGAYKLDNGSGEMLRTHRA